MNPSRYYVILFPFINSWRVLLTVQRREFAETDLRNVLLGRDVNSQTTSPSSRTRRLLQVGVLRRRVPAADGIHRAMEHDPFFSTQNFEQKTFLTKKTTQYYCSTNMPVGGV